MKRNDFSGFDKVIKSKKRKKTAKTVESKDEELEEPLMSGQLHETEKQKAFGVINTPALWKKLQELGYEYIHSSDTFLEFRKGNLCFTLTIKEK